MSTIYKMLLLLTVMFPFVEAHGQPLRLALDSASGQQGSQVEVALRARNFNEILSAQATIGFDPQIVAFDTVTIYGLPGLNPSSFGTSLLGSGKLTFSWDDATLTGISIPDDSALFTLRFSLIGTPGTESPLHFAATPVAPECADTSFLPVALDTVPGLIKVEDTVTVGLPQPNENAHFSMQLLPHPIQSNSLIRLQLMQEEVLNFRLLDFNGREAGSGERNLPSGETEIAFSEMFPNLPAGLYLLICEGSNGRNLIKTMIAR